MARKKVNPTTVRHFLSQYIAWCLYDKQEDMAPLSGPFMFMYADNTFDSYLEYLAHENIKRKPKWM